MIAKTVARGEIVLVALNPQMSGIPISFHSMVRHSQQALILVHFVDGVASLARTATWWQVNGMWSTEIAWSRGWSFFR